MEILKSPFNMELRRMRGCQFTYFILKNRGEPQETLRKCTVLRNALLFKRRQKVLIEK